MTPAASPGLPDGIEKLTIEFVNLNFQEVNNLWTVRGSLYLPSFLLKLRTITFATVNIRDLVPPVIRPFP
jgi:hypothetical protein